MDNQYLKRHEGVCLEGPDAGKFLSAQTSRVAFNELRSAEPIGVLPKDNRVSAVDYERRELVFVQMPDHAFGVWAIAGGETEAAINRALAAYHAAKSLSKLTGGAFSISVLCDPVQARTGTQQTEGAANQLQELIEAAERLRAGMNGHYVHAEDLYCFDTALQNVKESDK